MVCAALLFAAFASGPLDELDAARVVLARLVAQDAQTGDHRAQTTIFVSTLGTPPDKLDDLKSAFHYALNSVTFRRQPIRLTPAGVESKTLYTIDFEDLEWKAEAVQRLLAKEPYFYPFDPHVALMRADWFLKEATFGDTYYDLLDFGKTLNDLDKRVGLDRKTADNIRALHGARVVKSGVALNPRGVARFGATGGAYWETFDVAKATNDNIYEDIDKRFLEKSDAHEIFGPLPNGLYWWALANGKGQLVNAAPIDIAADRRAFVAADQLKDVVKENPSGTVFEIQNAHSCMGCHALGLRSAPDWVAETIRGDDLDVRTKDKKTRNKIEDFYDPKAQARAMKADTEALVEAIKDVTERPALAAGNTFAKIRVYYAEEYVTKTQAAAELNVSAATFEKLAQADDGVRLRIAQWFLDKGDQANAAAVLGFLGNGAADKLKAFLANQPVALGTNTLKKLAAKRGSSPVPRLTWEQETSREATLLICYQERARRACDVEQVREKMRNYVPPALRTDPERQPPKTSKDVNQPAADAPMKAAPPAADQQPQQHAPQQHAPQQPPPQAPPQPQPAAPRERPVRIYYNNVSWPDGSHGPGEWDGEKLVRVAAQ